MDSVGDLGFWIFVAALVVGNMWKESRQKAEKHETLRRIMEKTGTIDEAKLKELFSDAPADESKPGTGYRALRVSGAIVMFTGAGIATFVLMAAVLAKIFAAPMLDDTSGMIGVVGVAAGIATFGLGLFLSSRFAEPPSGTRSKPADR
jgi:hypothetical protein